MCVSLGPADVKPAASRVLSPSQTHQTVKAQTTAGILSKTSSTFMQKRVAHTPTMKVSIESTTLRASACSSEWLFCVFVARHSTSYLYGLQSEVGWVLFVLSVGCDSSSVLSFSERFNEAPRHPHWVRGQSSHQHPPALPQHFHRWMCQILPIRGGCLQYGMNNTQLPHALIRHWMQRRFNKRFSWTSSDRKFDCFRLLMRKSWCTSAVAVRTSTST